MTTSDHHRAEQSPAAAPGLADPKRRDVLRWSLGLSAGLILPPLTGCDSGGDGSAAVADTLPEASRIYARNGLIDIELVAAYTNRDVQFAAGAQNVYPGASRSLSADLRSYNGGLLAPTLCLNAGDTLRILLKNRLPGNDVKYSSLSYLNYQNSTNLHFHGMHVDPKEIRPGVYGDYMVDSPDAGVTPGADRQHEITLPAEHSNGIYWYHPHLHGSTTTQVLNGMFGAILVSTPRNDFDLPDSIRERVIFVHRLNLTDKGRSDNLYEYQDNNSGFVLNGAYQPTIVMRPGEIQNWHFINSDVFYPFSPVLDEHTLWHYARDGNVFARHYSAINADTVTQTDGRFWPGSAMYPGNRASMLVQASKTPGTYYLHAAKAPSGMEPEIVARIVVEGLPVQMDLPSPHQLPLYNNYQPITDAELAQHGGKTRAVILAVLDKDNPLLVQPIPEGEEWFIPANDDSSLSNLVFSTGNKGTKLAPFQSALAATQTVALNAVEEWTLYNMNGYPHPFHIHVNDCYVIKVNGEDIEPYWADTIPLAPGGTPDQPTSITFRSRFTDFTGKFVWHCHALDHEDMGMMELVEVLA